MLQLDSKITKKKEKMPTLQVFVHFFLIFLASPLPPPAYPSLNSSSHRGHDPLDRGGRLLLPLGLVHQRHAEVTEAERHALQDGLTRVGPVFRKLCKRRAKRGLKKINK